MAQQVQRWIEVTPSQFPHKVEGLNIVRSLLPDNAPFRAWSNLEFRDRQGKWHGGRPSGPGQASAPSGGAEVLLGDLARRRPDLAP